MDDHILVPKMRKERDGLDNMHLTGLLRKEQTADLMLKWFSCPYNPRKLQSPGRALLTQYTEKGISTVFGMTVRTSDDIFLKTTWYTEFQ